MSFTDASYRSWGHDSQIVKIIVVLFASVLSLAVSMILSMTAHAAVEQISTGASSACAVVDSKVRCWGSNDSGQLGKADAASIETKPVAVATNKDTVAAGPTVCTASILGFCTASAPTTPAIPASAIAGKTIDKVSVGKTHACALSNARVYCWGDNSHGQLGNRTNNNAPSPVAVDVQLSDSTPAPVTPNPCGGWFQPSCTPVAQPTKLKSALGNKEVIDITAGDYFTCALTSDGVVACWGEGDNGRLGNNSTSDYNYPQSVYVHIAIAAVAATPGKCVQSFFGNCTSYNPAPTAAKPAVPATALLNKKATSLSRVSGTSVCVTATGKTENVTNGVGNPYCWGGGMGNGTVPTDKSSSSSYTASSCSPSSSTTTSTAYFDALQPVQYSSTQQFTSIDTDGYATGIDTSKRLYNWGLNGYMATTVTTRSCGNGSGSGGLDSTGHMCGGGSNHGSPGCAAKVPVKTTSKTTYNRIGYLSPNGPLYNTGTATLNQKPINSTSGEATAGLLCANTLSGDTYCDANGTGSNNGQTGSGYSEKCTTSTTYIFGIPVGTKTVCDPAPTGPQQVVSSGWFSGKSIKQLSTGTSGYTCALANGSVACWGLNNKGQLGTGDTVNKNVPTAVVSL